MRNGIIVCRLSLIKTYLLAFHVLRKFRDVQYPFKMNWEKLGKIDRYVFSVNSILKCFMSFCLDTSVSPKYVTDILRIEYPETLSRLFIFLSQKCYQNKIDVIVISNCKQTNKRATKYVFPRIWSTFKRNTYTVCRE